MLKIIVNGCNGKMGQVLSKEILLRDELKLVAGIDRSPNKVNNDFKVYDDIYKFKQSADVIIDFSNPYYLPGLLDYSIKNNIGLVIATTGFSSKDLDEIKNASKKIPIFYSANMSLGINILISIIKNTTKILKDWDIEIIEKHHNKKVDSPSGTAYMIANKINESLDDKKEYVFGRYTKTDKRDKKEIGIHSIRAGSIVGEHTVLYAYEDEILEIKHSALSKKIFANGAINAAKFISNKKNGLYNMEDLVNIID